MSCEECEKFQSSDKSSFYRYDNANIEIRACPKHLMEIFAILNFFQVASREGKVGLLLHPDSWENMFKCIRDSLIKSEGNFWAAVQELERQFEELKKEEAADNAQGEEGLDDLS